MFRSLPLQLPAFHSIRIVAAALGALLALPVVAAAPPDAQSALSAFLSRPVTIPYPQEYPVIGYERMPADNPVARLQERLDRGEVRLEYVPVRGYLDAVLAALQIDPSSQTLVYSRTSFQAGTIRAATPRAIYFNDDTYVAWVQNTEMLEFGTFDTQLGPVFYTLPNQQGQGGKFEREMERCLSCHDTYLLSGGGVPRFMLGSSYVDVNGEQLTHEGRILTTDRTALRFRWGGWYVTGLHGDQVHLGNVLVRSARELVDLEAVRRGNLETLDGLFDTRPYLSNKSDIVANLILQHQVYVQNLITRVNFEVRTTLAKEATQGAVPPATQAKLQPFMDDLLNAMLFVDAAPIQGKITGNSGFDAWFEARGPRDGRGRSLRELDLQTRLFRHPLSYLIHSDAFAALPAYAKEYLYGRLTRILRGDEQGKEYSHLSGDDRRTLLEILEATHPEFLAASRKVS